MLSDNIYDYPCVSMGQVCIILEFVKARGNCCYNEQKELKNFFRNKNFRLKMYLNLSYDGGGGGLKVPCIFIFANNGKSNYRLCTVLEKKIEW